MGSSTSHPNEEKCGASSKTQMIWGKKITNEKTLKMTMVKDLMKVHNNAVDKKISYF